MNSPPNEYRVGARVRNAEMDVPEVDDAVIAVWPVEIADDSGVVAIFDGESVSVDEARQGDSGRRQPDDEDHCQHNARNNSRPHRMHNHHISVTDKTCNNI